MTRSTTDTAVAAHTDARRTSTTALLAALLAGSALLTIPLHPVPLTMQVFIVVLIALLVEPRWAAFAVGTYLLIGAAGLPVFAGLRGGVSSLVGPTGGFLFGFLIGAVAGAWTRVEMERRGAMRIAADCVAAGVVIGVVYLAGWAQLAFVANLTPLHALAAGVAPFVVVDVLKAAAAVAVVEGVRKAAGV